MGLCRDGCIHNCLLKVQSVYIKLSHTKTKWIIAYIRPSKALIRLRTRSLIRAFDGRLEYRRIEQNEKTAQIADDNSDRANAVGI